MIDAVDGVAHLQMIFMEVFMQLCKIYPLEEAMIGRLGSLE